MIEIFALPMVHTAWMTAVVFSLANGVLLAQRVRVGEEGLRLYNDSDAQLRRAGSDRLTKT